MWRRHAKGSAAPARFGMQAQGARVLSPNFTTTSLGDDSEVDEA
jgi:hypothetical protein